MDFSNVPVVGKVLGILALVNIAITAAKQICDKVASGSKADTYLGKACSMISWILGHLTANTTNTAAIAATVAQPAVEVAPAAQPAADAPKAQ